MASLCSSPSTRSQIRTSRARREALPLEQSRSARRPGRPAPARSLRRWRSARAKRSSRARRLFGDDRIERLGGSAQRLVEPEQQALAEAARQAGRAASPTSSPIVSIPKRRAAASAASSSRSAASGKRGDAPRPRRRCGQRLMRWPPKRASAWAAPVVPATAMRAAKPSRAQKAQDALAHRSLAAEQMGDAVEVEPQAVRARHGGARRPAPRGEQAEAGQQGRIGLRIGVADVEAGDQRARLGHRHARDGGRAPAPPGRRRRSPSAGPSDAG